MKRVLLIAFGVAAASASFSQALITSGTSSYGWTSTTDANISGATIRTGTGGGGSVVYTASGSADQMFQNWWWYRVNGVNSREFALSTLSSKTVSGNSMTLNYLEPEGFTARVEYTITEQSYGTLVTKTAFIRNVLTSGASLDMAFYDYFDFDLLPTSSTNSATLISDNPAIRMRITPATGPIFAEYRAIDGQAYQVGAFSGLRTLLTNATIDNLNNTGLPFGPGDFSGANEWNFVLRPGEQIAVQTSLLLNPVPEPGTFLAIGAGMGLLAMARRRRKA